MKIVILIVIIGSCLNVRINKKHKKQPQLNHSGKERMKKLNRELETCNKYRLEINDEVKVMENFHEISYEPCVQSTSILGAG